MIRVFKPREELRPYVRYYWALKSDEPFGTLTFPIGCPQMIFHWRTPLMIPELGVSQSSFTVSGQVNFPAHISSFGDLDMIVAVFYPHTAGMFLDTPPSEFYNLEISGHDLGIRSLTDMAEAIIDCRSYEEAIDILDARLMSKIRPSLNVTRIGNAVAGLMHGPSLTVAALAERVCLGRKQFERLFREYVGMNPKEYSRVARFQKSLYMMQRGERHFAGIAAECGYADQSHFIRDFRAMSGHTPKSLLSSCDPYSDLFTDPL